jgi:hypothetical protein
MVEDLQSIQVKFSDARTGWVNHAPEQIESKLLSLQRHSIAIG